jgi:hypothetical protein
MWAHYAAKYQGVCPEFAVRNNLFYHALEVQYSVDYPQHRMTGFSGSDEHIAPLVTKSAAWSYENEFRLISDENGDPRVSIVTTDGKKALASMSLTVVILRCQHAHLRERGTSGDGRCVAAPTTNKAASQNEG